MKLSYATSFQKRKVREHIFSQYKLKRVTGLGGPDVGEYVSFFRQRGYSTINIWENSTQIMLRQLPQLAGMGVSYQLGDILDAPVEEDTLYDIDFCSSIKTTSEHVKKFRRNTVFTFACRPVDALSTIKIFSFDRGEAPRHLEFQDGSGFLITDWGHYGLQTYYDRDGHYLMLMIYCLN